MLSASSIFVLLVAASNGGVQLGDVINEKEVTGFSNGIPLSDYDDPTYYGGIAPAPDFSGISLVNGGRKLFKLFTRSNYRTNLKIFSGLDGVGLDAHHIFPQAKRFAKYWDDLGINIHHPKNMTWWKSGSHRMNAAKYNQYWDDFFSTYVNPTKKQAEEYGKWLMDLFD